MFIMIKSYFKIAFRNLLKNKTFGLLNIAGLAIGITCTALIMLWVEDEAGVVCCGDQGRHEALRKHKPIRRVDVNMH